MKMNIENQFSLEQGKLYLLSGIPGSGKSTWASLLPKGVVISTDALRESILGTRIVGGRVHHYQEANGAVFLVARTIVAARMREKLTTFVDAMLLTDADRGEFVALAREFGVEVEVLIFDRDLETVLARNASRAAQVPPKQIEALHGELLRKSQHPYRLVPDGSVPVLRERSLPFASLDVVGDVHGLFDELLELLGKLGYTLDSSGVPVHPQGRKLLFLGDVVDRGPKSIETLQFLRRAVAAGHFAIAGNHERKLLQFWAAYQAGEPQARSRSSAETAMSFMALGDADRAVLIDFIRKLPGHYVLEASGRRMAFAHATLVHFDPLATLYTECLYGSEGLRESGEKDPDAVYARNHAAGDNAYWLFRGHIPATSIQDSVFSLEREQAFAGHLVALRLDAFLADCDSMAPAAAFERNVVTHKCEFNFDDHSERFKLSKALDQLVLDKLATTQTDRETGCRIYKYSKRVFFDALWGESDYLAKARGIVLDVAGNIVVHPFDKVFNYGENGAGKDIQDDHMVLAVEKLNGFLANISKHPFKNELLLTTSGSFESPFVEYIRSFITPALKGRLLRFFSKHNMTLAFECVHGEDPHIIEYPEAYHGLWLIGARGKDEHAPQALEKQLDLIALELALPRPNWFAVRFGELKAMVATSKLEGYMVRDLVTQETLLKFKTPYYLVTKFLGRLSANKTRFLYANPREFKKTIDEEFFELVDGLVANVPEAEFSAMDDVTRTAMVRGLIADMR